MAEILALITLVEEGPALKKKSDPRSKGVVVVDRWKEQEQDSPSQGHCHAGSPGVWVMV